MAAEHPWQALPPEVAEVLRPELPGLADEIVDRAEPRRAGLRPAARGPVRQGASHRSGGGARALHRHGGEPAGGSRRGPGGVPEPRPRRDARGSQPRCAARGIPARRAGGLAAARGGGRAGRPPAAHPLRARRGDLRLHRRAVGRTRSRAMPASRRPRLGRSSAGASAWPPCSSRSRRPRPPRWRPRPRTQPGGCRAAWPRWSWTPRERRGERRAGRPPGAPARPRGAGGTRGPFIVALVAAGRAPGRAGGGGARAPRRARPARSHGRRPA